MDSLYNYILERFIGSPVGFFNDTYSKNKKRNIRKTTKIFYDFSGLAKPQNSVIIRKLLPYPVQLLKNRDSSLPGTLWKIRVR